MLMPKLLKPRSKTVLRMVVPMTRRNRRLRSKPLPLQASLNKSDIINTIIHLSHPSSSNSSLREHPLAPPRNSILVCSHPRCPTHTIRTTSSMVNCRRTIKTRRTRTRFKLPRHTILSKDHNNTRLRAPGLGNLSIQCKVGLVIALPRVRMPCRFRMLINSNTRHNMVSEVRGWLPTMQAFGKFPNPGLAPAKFQMAK